MALTICEIDGKSYNLEFFKSSCSNGDHYHDMRVSSFIRYWWKELQSGVL